MVRVRGGDGVKLSGGMVSGEWTTCTGEGVMVTGRRHRVMATLRLVGYFVRIRVCR